MSLQYEPFVIRVQEKRTVEEENQTNEVYPVIAEVPGGSWKDGIPPRWPAGLSPLERSLISTAFIRRSSLVIMKVTRRRWR